MQGALCDASLSFKPGAEGCPAAAKGTKGNFYASALVTK